jgi:hypothetical protein
MAPACPGLFVFWLGNGAAKGHLGEKECDMPLQTLLLLLTAVIAAAGVTIALAFVLGLNFVWLGLAAALAAVAIRTWA